VLPVILTAGEPVKAVTVMLATEPGDATAHVPLGAATATVAGEPDTEEPEAGSLKATVPIAHWSPELTPVHDDVSEPPVLFLYPIQTSSSELPFTALASRVYPDGTVTVSLLPKSPYTATRYSLAAAEEYVGEPVEVALPFNVPAVPSSAAAVVLPVARPEISCTRIPTAPVPETVRVTADCGVAGTS
jgi:hypothetical protein